MINALIGSKGRMDQFFVEGFRIPTTSILVGPCVVTSVKQISGNLWQVQLGFGLKRIKNVSKSVQGHLKASIKDNKAPRYIKVIKSQEDPKYNVGDTLKVADIFSIGDVVSVSGKSKGKGFAGVVKRWHFHGGPRTHGQSDRERAPGSIGQTTTPGRVLKGKKMAGRMGSQKVSVKGLHIVSVTPERDEIQVSGPIPGITGGVVVVTKLSSGSLKELEHDTVGQKVVEGEAKIEATGEETKDTEVAPEKAETKS